MPAGFERESILFTPPAPTTCPPVSPSVMPGSLPLLSCPAVSPSCHARHSPLLSCPTSFIGNPCFLPNMCCPKMRFKPENIPIATHPSRPLRHARRSPLSHARQSPLSHARQSPPLVIPDILYRESILLPNMCCPKMRFKAENVPIATPSIPPPSVMPAGLPSVMPAGSSGHPSHPSPAASASSKPTRTSGRQARTQKTFDIRPSTCQAEKSKASWPERPWSRSSRPACAWSTSSPGNSPAGSWPPAWPTPATWLKKPRSRETRPYRHRFIEAALNGDKMLVEVSLTPLPLPRRRVCGSEVFPSRRICKNHHACK